MDPNTNPSEPQIPTPIPAPVFTQPQPVVEPTPQFAGTPIQSPKKPLNKKLLVMIGAIVAGVIVVGVVILLLANAVFGISKKDYQDAYSTVSTVTDKGSSSVSDLSALSYISSSNTQTQVTNDLESAQKTLDEYKTANAALKDLKAFRNADVKVKYEAYSKKFDAYTTYATNFISSYKKLYAAVVATSTANKATDYASIKPLLVNAKAAYDDAKAVADKDFATYAGAASDALGSYITAVEAYMATASNDYTTRSKVRTDIYSAQDILSAASKDFNSNVSKHFKEVSPRDSYNDLIDVLNTKIKA